MASTVSHLPPPEVPCQKKPDADKPKKNTLSLYGPSKCEVSALLRDIRPVLERPENESDLDIVAAAADVPLSVEMKKKLSDLQVSNVMSCTACGIVFDTRDEQKSHFRTDWHLYNTKQKLRGLRPVAAMEFEDMADAISSLSGSDSSSDDEGTANQSFSKHRLVAERIGEDITCSDDEVGEEVIDGREKIVFGSAQSKLYLRTSSNQLLSLYRCILCTKKEEINDTDELLRLVELLPSQTRWMVIMMGGGHFAAAIFDNGEVLVHKTFHRYVVRAKAGTSQSQHDKKGGHAQSAGAQIRRQNEAALAQDITDLLLTWKDDIAQCHKIFIRVATHNYSYIFNKKEKHHLNKNDRRISTIPFATRRATFREVKRVYDELSSVKIYDPSAKLPKELSEANTSPSRMKKATTSQIKPSAKSSPSRKKRQDDFDLVLDDGSPDGEDDEGECELGYSELISNTRELKEFGHYIPSQAEILEQRSEERKRRNRNKKPAAGSALAVDVPERLLLPYRTEFYTACVAGDVEQLKALVSTHQQALSEASTSFSAGISLPISQSGQTLLHVACMNNHSDLVEHLLDIGCDPSVSDDKKIVPYLSTQNKNVRLIFRLFMNDYPDKYDYIKAQIPGPLSRESIAEKEAKDAEKRREINKKKKERAKAKKAETTKVKAEEEEKQRFLALSDREKRALAAERRLLSQATNSVESTKTAAAPTLLNLKRCYECATDITGKVPFEYSNNVFCTPVCLKAHRLKEKSKT